LRNQLTIDLNTKKRKHEDEVLQLQEEKHSIGMEIQQLETDKENIDSEVRFVQSYVMHKKIPIYSKFIQISPSL
jgi:hypothetical protein